MKIKNTIIIAITAITSSLLSLLIAGVCVMLYVLQPFQKEAVDRGFASWVVTNTSNGATEFQWGESDLFYQLDKPLAEPLSMGCNL